MHTYADYYNSDPFIPQKQLQFVVCNYYGRNIYLELNKHKMMHCHYIALCIFYIVM